MVWACCAPLRSRGLPPNRRMFSSSGSGGAARVAGYEFLAKGGRVTFAVRNKQKGEELVRELADMQKDGHHRLSVCSLNDCAGAHDLLINCTPVGMYPYSDACPVGGEIIDRCRAVFDAVYKPQRNASSCAGKAKGYPGNRGIRHAVLSGCRGTRILVWS